MLDRFEGMDRNKKIIFIGGAAAAAVLIIVIIICIAFSGNSRKYSNAYDAAEMAYLGGNYEQAIKKLEIAMDIDPTEECYLLMAESYHALGDTDMAVQVLYLGYSRLGSKVIDNRLQELKGLAPEDKDEAGKDEEPESDGIKIAGKDVSSDVKSLLLSDKGLTDSDIREISKLEFLESLSLSGNSITELSPLSGLEQLNFLQLSDNRISDISPLAQLSNLKTLYTDNNPIEDFTPLYGLSALRTLSMKGVSITGIQLKELEEALPNCNIFTDEVEDAVVEITMGNVTFKSDVTELDLRGQNIVDLSPLSLCTKLVKLDLRDNAIADISALVDLQELEWLCLWNNKVENISPLMSLSKLKHLDLDNNSVKDLSVIPYLTNIEALWISSNPLEDIEVLTQLPNLRRLGLKNTDLQDEDLDVLIKLTKLTELTIENNPKLTANKFDELEAALTGCEISHSELFYKLKLGDAEFSSDAISISAAAMNVSDLSGLEHFTKLKTLVLSSNAISDIGPVSGCTELEVLDVYSNGISDIEPLKALTKLRSLSLLDNSLTSIAALSGLTELTELALGYNSITDLSPIAGLTKLHDLYLDSNGISDISALSGLSSLTYLSLENNNITDLSPLMGLSSLKDLYISGNSGLTAEAVRELQKALPDCRIVTDLDLSEPVETPVVTEDPFIPDEGENTGTPEAGTETEGGEEGAAE